MDVGDPSNFVRIRQLFSGNIDDLPSALSASSYSDSQTEAAIFELYKDHHYLADPHGAVGYLALRDFLQAHPGQKGIFLETAHPVKFFDVVEPIIDRTIDLPDQVKQIMNKEETAVGMQAETIKLKEFLLEMN